MSRKDHLNHKPNADGIAKIENLKRHIIALDKAIEADLPEGSEKSIAQIKLEECRMWAVKGAVVANAESVDDIE